jgi:hypothetical protein
MCEDGLRGTSRSDIMFARYSISYRDGLPITRLVSLDLNKREKVGDRQTDRQSCPIADRKKNEIKSTIRRGAAHFPTRLWTRLS